MKYDRKKGTYWAVALKQQQNGREYQYDLA